MSSRFKLVRNLALITLYVGAVVGFYFADFFLGVMVLTIPWSMGVIMLGFLLIHAASYDLTTYMLGGAAINALLMFRWALVSFASGDNPE